MTSSGAYNETRGTGFVHLNTPASIHYTAGQTLSLSALRQRKTRVECVALPESMSVWRCAFQRYAKEEGYGSYAADVEDERMGNGVVLPPLVPQRSGPQRRRAQDSISAQDAFFCSAVPAARRTGKAPEKRATQAATSEGGRAEAPAPASAYASASNKVDRSPTVSTCSTSSPAKGITIVSHHKVAGRQEFLYPDHDGVLSAGVVPQIVTTAEEKAEAEAEKQFYVSALDMSEEELAALEELQALWKSRARSHSFLGAQHRSASKGAIDPLAVEQMGEDVLLGNRAAAGAGGRPPKSRRVEGGHSAAGDAIFAEAETKVDDVSTVDKELAEALRLADELLRFA